MRARRSASAWMAHLLGIALLFGVMAASASAQTTVFNPSPSTGSETASPLPLDAELTPEQIDGLLARMTDAEIRQLLIDRLISQAQDTQQEDMSTAEIVDFVTTRLVEMETEIAKRLGRWIPAVLNLQNRRYVVAERLAEAEDGVFGMILAAFAVVSVGVIAAMAVSWLTREWRRWLSTPTRDAYWDKVIRTIFLGLIETLPIFAFALATNQAMAMSAGALGRLTEIEWIYTAGISTTWEGLVIARRLFAPDAAAIRIAPIDDDLSARVYRVLRVSAIIGAGSWIIGGLWFHLGFGFPPALLSVAAGGTAIAIVLLIAVLRNVDGIRAATEAVFGVNHTSALRRIAIAIAPWTLAGYIGVAYLFWLAHWLEQGMHRLYGPLGTLIVYITLPIVDRLGQEIVRSILRHPGEMAERFRRVFYLAWRLLIGVAALLFVVWLWGLNLITFVSGDLAPGWVGVVTDVVVTLMITWLIWELIKAALHSDKKFVSVGEDLDPTLAPKATRLDTLTPLFRGILLVFVAAVGFMFILAESGVDIGPLLASAGIIGIAVGFGAQALVRDIFSGMFFLIDDAFRVGEYIELTEDLRGDVESISIRSLQLRHHRGPVITIPFGEMKNITNHTRDWILYKMPFRMEPDTDPQVFKKIVKRVGAEFMEHPDHGPKFFEPLKSQGVYYVDDDSALVFRVKFKCKPRAQFVLRREIYHRLRQVFEESGLKLARRKVEVVSGDDDKPLSVEQKGLPDDVLDTVTP